MSDEHSSKIRPLRLVPRDGRDAFLEETMALLTSAVRSLEQREFSQDDLSDQNVVEDKDAFRHRFGIGFSWPLHQRQELMRLRAEKNISDMEIRGMRYTGGLVRRPVGVKICGNPWLAILGFLGIAYLLLVTTVVFGKVLQSNTMPMSQQFGTVLVLTALFGLGYVLFLAYILPWLVMRRSSGANGIN